jgi:SsrA-binding protein
MNIIIRNKRAYFDFSILDKYTAGIQLIGTEVKSIKNLKASISEAYCIFINNELYIKNMHITEYANIKYTNHIPNRDRKLLLNKNEINKLLKAIKERGLTIIPINVHISDTGYIKLEIGLARGKNGVDKRSSIKEKEIKRELQNNK